MASNYDKICTKICQTEDWREYENTIRRRLQTYDVCLASFDVRLNNKDPPPYFLATFDGSLCVNGLRRDFLVYSGGPRSVIDWNDIVYENELANIATQVWNSKTTPTYNCTFSRSGKRKSKGYHSVVERFVDFARTYIMSSLSPEFNEASDRIRKFILDFNSSDNFEKLRQECIERVAIDDIKNSLIRYRHLDDRVLRTAFKEFIVGDILES